MTEKSSDYTLKMEQTIEDFPKVQLEGLQPIISPWGIWQHVDKNGKRHNGQAHSSDDQARALQITRRYFRHFDADWFRITFPRTCLEYAINAQRPDGLFNNYCSERGGFIDDPAGKLYDVFGRWMLALAEASDFPDKTIAGESKKLFNNKLEVAESVIIPNATPHSTAFLTLAMAKMIEKQGFGEQSEEARRTGSKAASVMQTFYDEYSRPDWEWVDNTISYCSGRIPQAFLSASLSNSTSPFTKFGLSCLDFFTKVSFENEIFSPVGNKNGFYTRGNEKPKYCQQSVEAGVAALAYEAAFKVTGDEKYKILRDASLQWYFRKNSKRQSLLREKGVCDAVTATGINENQGAESRLAFLLGMSTRLSNQ